MKKLSILSIVLIFAAITSCKDQLDIKNPNAPTAATAQTERGITGFASGGVYINGFFDLKFYDGVPGRFWSGAVGFHELMGDIVGEEAANIYGNQLGCPDDVVLDDGTTHMVNPQSPKKQHDLIRLVNSNQQQGNNPLFYEWAYMYAMNNAMNIALGLVDGVPFVTDADTKTAVIKAWAYFWKGYAYSRVGSIYYAGIINDVPYKTNGDYVSKEAIIAEAEKNFAACETILNGLSSGGAYDEILGKLIPDICQVGKGEVPSPTSWKHVINTMRARNILVNTPAASMTSAQWNQILTLTNNGISKTDNVFTMRANTNGDIMSASAGNVAAKTYGSTAQGGTYKVSERLIQDFRVGDKRLANNFKQTAAWIGNSDRGNTFNTRWALLDGGNNMAGVTVMCDRSDGGYELYVSGFYEENELMKAEANIYLGSIDTGLGSLDAVRAYQGAGLAATVGTGLTAPQAKEELRSERRVALAFRGYGFYDARRWGVINTGRTKCVVIDKAGVVNTNATISYNFLDYWDVPDNELVYNAPSATAVPTKNPTN